MFEDIPSLKEGRVVDVRERLALAEFPFYGKMIACGIHHIFPYSCVGRCHWKLNERWDVPVILEDPDHLLKSPKSLPKREWRRVSPLVLRERSELVEASDARTSSRQSSRSSKHSRELLPRRRKIIRAT